MKFIGGSNWIFKVLLWKCKCCLWNIGEALLIVMEHFCIVPKYVFDTVFGLSLRHIMVLRVPAGLLHPSTSIMLWGQTCLIDACRSGERYSRIKYLTPLARAKKCWINSTNWSLSIFKTLIQTFQFKMKTLVFSLFCLNSVECILLSLEKPFYYFTTIFKAWEKQQKLLMSVYLLLVDGQRSFNPKCAIVLL